MASKYFQIDAVNRLMDFVISKKKKSAENTDLLFCKLSLYISSMVLIFTTNNRRDFGVLLTFFSNFR